jgi:hypothetical protein
MQTASVPLPCAGTPSANRCAWPRWHTLAHTDGGHQQSCVRGADGGCQAEPRWRVMTPPGGAAAPAVRSSAQLVRWRYASRARLLSVPDTAIAGPSMQGLICVGLEVYVNQRFTKALSFVQTRSGLYVDWVLISEYGSELSIVVHSCAPGLVSGLVSMSTLRYRARLPSQTASKCGSSTGSC